jgi:hypothetical protein
MSGPRRRLIIVLLMYVGMPLAVIGLAISGQWALVLLYVLFPIEFTVIIMALQRAWSRKEDA